MFGKLRGQRLCYQKVVVGTWSEAGKAVVGPHSDSQSTLQELNTGSSNSPRELTTLVVIIHQIMSNLNINITEQWIPGHIGIVGNEKADKLLKAGSSMEQPDRPANYLTIRSKLFNNHKEEY